MPLFNSMVDHARERNCPHKSRCPVVRAAAAERAHRGASGGHGMSPGAQQVGHVVAVLTLGAVLALAVRRG
ncbi:hypothetical protein GCM10009654_40160 [Streptomyces hebeiensis]|uniref:Uncharacterized protein n=1 Tax=Streptomyces hebeiensis TaxID=229486 RepID=A0ABN1UXG5_9ACTN